MVKFKRMAAWLLSAVLAVSYMPLSVMATDEMPDDPQAVEAGQTLDADRQLSNASSEHAEIIGSGEIGENLSYAVYSDGLLKVEGYGETYGYGSEPLAEYASVITKVELPEGITRVRQYAFSGLIIPGWRSHPIR